MSTFRENQRNLKFKTNASLLYSKTTKFIFFSKSWGATILRWGFNKNIFKFQEILKIFKVTVVMFQKMNVFFQYFYFCFEKTPNRAHENFLKCMEILQKS